MRAHLGTGTQVLWGWQDHDLLGLLVDPLLALNPLHDLVIGLHIVRSDVSDRLRLPPGEDDVERDVEVVAVVADLPVKVRLAVLLECPIRFVVVEAAVVSDALAPAEELAERELLACSNSKRTHLEQRNI